MVQPTLEGNSQNRGTLYEYDIATKKHTVKYAFNFSNGSKPFSDPIVAKSGLLYGLTSGGGRSNGGALYEYNITTNRVTPKSIIFRFSRQHSRNRRAAY